MFRAISLITATIISIPAFAGLYGEPAKVEVAVAT